MPAFFIKKCHIFIYINNLGGFFSKNNIETCSRVFERIVSIRVVGGSR